MTQGLTTTLDQLLEDFAFLGEDWEARYTHLIELGKQLLPMDPALKTEDNKVQGCMSQVWLVVRQSQNGQFQLEVESDSHIVRGLAAVLLLVFDGKTSAQIRSLDIEELFVRLGLSGHLSPSRRNGFFSMVAKIRALTA